MAKRSSSGAVVSLKAPPKAKALVDEGLDALNLEFTIFDQNLKLVANNKTFSELRKYPVELLQPGTDIIELYRFNAERGDYGPGDVEAQAPMAAARPDLSIIYDHTLKSDVLRTEPLATEEHFLLCAPSDPLASRQSIPLAEVASLPLALPSREHGLRVAVDQFMQPISCALRLHTELDSIVGLKQLAEEGRVYTILPRGEIQEDLAAGKIRTIPITDPAVFRTLFVAWSNERPNTPQMKAVFSITKREIARIIREGKWGSTFLG